MNRQKLWYNKNGHKLEAGKIGLSTEADKPLAESQ